MYFGTPTPSLVAFIGVTIGHGPQFRGSKIRSPSTRPGLVLGLQPVYPQNCTPEVK